MLGHINVSPKDIYIFILISSQTSLNYEWKYICTIKQQLSLAFTS